MTDRMPARDALREALAVAIHSPSSHNSQAWSLRIMEEKTGPVLELGVDHHRQLCTLPAHWHEMLLGLGSYWHALTVALRARGWTLEHDAKHASTYEGVALRGRLTPSTLDDSDATEATLVTERRTDRGPYTDVPLEAAGIDEFVASARTRPSWAATTPLPDVRVVTDPTVLGKVAALTQEVSPRDFLHRRAWKETVHYLHRDAAAASATDGFAYGQIFGRKPWPLDHAVVALTSPLLMPLTGRLGLADTLSRGLAGAVRAGTGFAVMTAPTTVHSPADWAWLGTDLHRAWLTATRRKMAVHPVSVLLQHDDSRKNLERLLDLPGRAFFVGRIGYSASGRTLGPTPRRDPHSVLTDPIEVLSTVD